MRIRSSACICLSLVLASILISSPASAFLHDSLVVYLPFDEGSGTVAKDYSGNNNNGAITGATWTTGKYGSALNFPGTSYVNLDTLEVDTSAGGHNTVEFWMYWTGANGVMPFGWQSTYDLYFAGGCFGFNTGQSNVLGFSSSGLANRWVHVVADFYNGVPNVNDNAIYIDGVKQTLGNCLGTTSASKSATASARVSGWRYSNNYYFRGMIDDFRIYDRSLSDQEIINNYQKSRPEILSLSMSANIDQVYVSWITDYPEDVNVECTLNGAQMCTPFPYSGKSGGGSCVIENPSYNMNKDPSGELRTVKNTLACKAYDQLYSGAYSEQTKAFYPISFQVSMPNSISSTVGDETNLAITIKNNGTLSDSYKIKIVSSNPDRLLVENGDQTTSILGTNYIQQIYSKLIMLTTQSASATVQVSSELSELYQKISFQGALSMKGGVVSLPDFDVFGMVQIILLSSLVLVSFLFSKSGTNSC